MKISFIIPVYNRPNEVFELLNSLKHQEDNNFEIIVVEDGSQIRCKDIYESFMNHLNIHYFFKENTGPGLSRNFGCERAQGELMIFLDSDCVIPPHYVSTIRDFFKNTPVDCFGGPDAAHDDFSDLQKAINYAMTSFFTTGGIRGGSEKMEKFHPRSFNMGITKEVYRETGGFPNIRFAYAKAAGEDLDLSIQIIKAGFKTALIADAYVYHKRRTSFKQFIRQVYNFGIARISISIRHPESLKLLHGAPTFFLIGTLILLLLTIFRSIYFITPLLFYMLLVFFDSSIKNKSMRVGALSILTSFLQLFGYGWGFLEAFWKQRILKRKMF